MNKDMPMLILREGPGAGAKWLIDKEVIVIGREDDCDVVIPERRVSRHHAEIRWRDGQYYLRDLRSKNGTYLNGREVIEPVPLQDGDEIQIALCARLAFVGAEATVPLSLEEPAILGLRLDKAGRRVWIGGRELLPPLSPAQYRLLELLYDREGQVCSRDEIVDAVWPEAAEDGVTEQAIDALVRRLRDRLAELDPHHQYVVTVRGHGFRFENRG